jgi:hypothetical protein
MSTEDVRRSSASIEAAQNGLPHVDSPVPAVYQRLAAVPRLGCDGKPPGRLGATAFEFVLCN